MTLSFFFLNFDSVFWNSTPEKIANIWSIKRDKISAIKFEPARLLFLSDVFVTVEASCYGLRSGALIRGRPFIRGWAIIHVFSTVVKHDFLPSRQWDLSVLNQNTCVGSFCIGAEESIFCSRLQGRPAIPWIFADGFTGRALDRVVFNNKCEQQWVWGRW